LDAGRTWCAGADRFALAILLVEFLVLDKGAPLAAEGGMFRQDELCARSGHAVDLAREGLKRDYPAALPLFEAAIGSNDFADCPSPEDWNQFFDTIPEAPARPPRLTQLETIAPDFFERLLKKRRPAAPIWPAPRLDEMPMDELHLPTRSGQAV